MDLLTARRNLFYGEKLSLTTISIVVFPNVFQVYGHVRVCVAFAGTEACLREDKASARFATGKWGRGESMNRRARSPRRKREGKVRGTLDGFKKNPRR